VRLSVLLASACKSQLSITSLVFGTLCRYKEEDLSFAGLKPRDEDLVEFLQFCGGLDLHLTTIVKFESIAADFDWVAEVYPDQKQVSHGAIAL